MSGFLVRVWSVSLLVWDDVGGTPLAYPETSYLQILQLLSINSSRSTC